MLNRTQIFCLVVTLLFIFGTSKNSQAAVIFEDDFDNNCSGAQCLSDGCNSSYPDGWDQWHCEDSQPITRDSITHYAGEITAPGRGGTGKSLKIWRYNQIYGNYTGPLVKYMPGTYNHIFFRYYQKIPSSFLVGGDMGYKFWRWNTSGGGGEIYLNYACNLDCNSDSVLTLHDNTSRSDVLNHSDLVSLFDNNWHCFQWDLDLSARTAVLYIDGVQKWSGAKSGFGGNFQFIQHFPLGNSNQGHVWQGPSTWHYIDSDDVVVATTKAETDPIQNSDIIFPASPQALSVW